MILVILQGFMHLAERGSCKKTQTIYTLGFTALLCRPQNQGALDSQKSLKTRKSLYSNNFFTALNPLVMTPHCIAAGRLLKYSHLILFRQLHTRQTTLHQARSSNQTGVLTNVQEVNNRFEVTHWAGMQVEAAGGGGEQQECGDDISSCSESDLKVGTSIKLTVSQRCGTHRQPRHNRLSPVES